MSRLLFLSRWLPYPPQNGSQLRIFNLLRALAEYHEVTLVSFTEAAPPTEAEARLRTLCREVRLVPWQRYDATGWPARRALFTTTPRSLTATESPAMTRTLAALLESSDFDLVIASQIDTAYYHPHFEQLPAIFEEAEVAVPYEAFTHAGSLRQRARFGLTWFKYRAYLGRLLRRYALCTVVSRQERSLLQQAAPGYSTVEVVPNGLPLADYCSVRKEVSPHTLVFAGSLTYQPNHDAMCWFLKEVFPLVRARVPAARLIITGNHDGRSLPCEEQVTRTGMVPDVRPLIADAAVSLAPIWTGGGSRLKILEAMALRTPVVATTKGAEGLDVQHGLHLLLADTPQAYADAVVRLLQSPAEGRSLVDCAYDLTRDRYDWTAIMERFLPLVEQVARG